MYEHWEKVNVVPVPSTAIFHLKDELKKINARVQEARVDGGARAFGEIFLTLVEKDVGDATLAIYQLQQTGGYIPEWARCQDIKMAHFFALLKAQSQGEEGPLNVKWCNNVALVHSDVRKCVFPVYTHWASASDYLCWTLYAGWVESLVGWHKGTILIAQNV